MPRFLAGSSPSALLDGLRNSNYRVDWQGEPAKLRIPRKQEHPFDQVVWSESTILDALQNRIPGVPRVLDECDGGWLHSFTPGEALSTRRDSVGVPADRIRGWLADFFTELARVPVESLPERPVDWPPDGDSRAFLLAQIRWTREELAASVWPGYEALLRRLSFPENALDRFEDRLPESMVSRPFMLLHGDLHAGNIILSPDDGPPRLIDWELALFGDPLHDLAMHLERFGYRKREQRRLVQMTWKDAVGSVRPGAVEGLDQDLPWYVGFQRVRSVYVDVVRTCANVERIGEAEAVRRLVSIVSRALPWLGGGVRPSTARVERALTDWRRSQ